MPKPTIYLAGRVQHVDDGGADWRNEIINEYGDEYDFNNPLDKYNVPKDELTVVEGPSWEEDTVSVTEIVEGDKTLLNRADAVLVGYSEGKSVGTPMEVMLAWEWDLPVAIWVRDGTDFEDLSPWYRYHAGAYSNSAEMALQHLDRKLVGEIHV